MSAVKNKQDRKLSLNRKLTNIIAVVLVFILVAIVYAAYKGLDIVYLGYSAVQTFFGEREIYQAYRNADDDFFIVMDNIEREYEITVEIYSGNNELVYSSSYKDVMSAPPYNGNVIVLPDSEKKAYTEVMDLGETEGNRFSLQQNTENDRNSEYLVGEWYTSDGTTFKIFKLKSVVDATAKITVTFISFITIAVLIAALILITILIRRITKPLYDMSKITHSMSELDFSQKCAPNNIREISLLSDSINDMSESLENALVDLRQKNKKLQDDIEQEKTIDELRKVFISGVSHELKTPIAIIQGYSEGLKVFMETDPEMAQKYCDTIMDETNRMNNLVMKLLDIIRYESGEYKLSNSSFNLHQLFEDWIDRNNQILSEKGITAENGINESFTACGDLFITTTVINNYMTNAVYHTSGEMKITVSAKELDGERYRVSVFNTGTPIAAKDIDQIWNSFYRADKAMSRSQGHFGLGLAIVVAIQKLHEQDYGVINHEDGVEFWFDVKKF